MSTSNIKTGTFLEGIKKRTVNLLPMFSNYLKIALRNLWRNKTFSAINIFGLTIGIATFLLIMLYILNELSYDRYNDKADRIVRVIFKGTVQGEKMNEANVMPPTAQTLKADYPEVQEATRLRNYGNARITYGDNTFNDDAFAYADSNFFQVFTIPLLRGDAKTALLLPNTVVISRNAAHKYFGNADPIGKILNCKDWNTAFKVTGVFDKVPENSHFHFDLFASMAGLPDSRSASWMTSEYYTYLVLPAGYDYKRLEAKLPQAVERYMGPQLQQSMGMSLTQFRAKGNDIGLFLQPLTDIHLHSESTNDLQPGGDIRYVYIFGAIALFMLIIACINFMNLSTAGAAKRAREVGIRKVLGSLRWELVRQFLLESIFLTAIALILAVALVYCALPLFNDLIGKNLSLRLTSSPWLWSALLLVGLITGVLAGSYPAFFLSSFNPVSVLKGKFTSGKGSIGLRSGLVVFQFFISIALIVGTTVVFDQLSYIQNKKLGYVKDQVIILSGTWVLGNNEQVFRQQVSADPRVQNVSASGFLPAGPSDNNNFFVYGDHNATQLVKTLRYDVDYQYIPTMSMQMAAGRNFARDFATDSTGVILNETAANALGWDANPLDHTITNRDNGGIEGTFHVIGVVKDFHFRSLHERISPLVMMLGNNSGTLIIKTKTKDIAGLLSTLKKQWTAFKPDFPFSYSFLDERFNNTYRSEQETGLILGIFAGLTIFVACLGLFGLVTFTAEQRTREIGIRKVIGASVVEIVALLSKDLLKLVCIAFLIAAPVAWFIMNRWLQDFVYRTRISWWVFVLTAVLAIVITLITVSFRAVKVALSNPVKSLKSE